MKKTILKLFLFLFVFGCKTKENEVVILPEGYTGYIVIIFGQEEGLQKKYENGKRVYEIPPSGILKTQFGADYGRSDFPEFYYGSHNGKELPIKIDWEDFSGSDVNATLFSVGKSYRDNGSNEPIEYVKAYIGTKSQIEAAVKEAERLDIISIADQE